MRCAPLMLGSRGVNLEPSCAAEGALVTFGSWLSLAGAYLNSNLALSCSTYGRGVRASSDVGEGEVVASLPLNLLITSDAALSDPQLRASPVRGTNLMALFLLRQREADARWHPFFNVLPRALHTTLFWSEAELAELQESELASMTRARVDAVESHYESLPENLNVHLSAADFRWALSILWCVKRPQRSYVRVTSHIFHAECSLPVPQVSRPRR